MQSARRMKYEQGRYDSHLFSQSRVVVVLCTAVVHVSSFVTRVHMSFLKFVFPLQKYLVFKLVEEEQFTW